MKKVVLIFLSLAVTCSNVFAVDEHISLGVPAFSGTGCQPGTVGFALSPDEEELSILFDNYTVEAGNGTYTDRKNCAISIPITIPNGFFITILQADYRGFNSLPKGSTSKLLTIYSFEGEPIRKQPRARVFRGPLQEDFLDTTREHAMSTCGKPVLFNIDTSIIVSTNGQQEKAFSQIDTLDTTADKRNTNRKLKYMLKLRRCGPPRRDR